MKRTWIAMGVLSLALAVPAHAQELDPMDPILSPFSAVAAYTTDDPIGIDRYGSTSIGLATPDGRFQIAPLYGCDWLSSGQNVLIYPNFTVPPWLKLSTPDGEPDCLVRVDGRMDMTPCRANDDGICAVDLESS